MIAGLAAAMFRIVPNPTFKAPVQLTVPGADAPVVATFEFRHKDVRAYEDWADRAWAEVIKHGEKTDLARILDEVIVGWPGIGDEDGRPLPYSVENLATLLRNYHTAGEEIATAYRRQLREARSKN